MLSTSNSTNPADRQREQGLFAPILLRNVRAHLLPLGEDLRRHSNRAQRRLARTSTAGLSSSTAFLRRRLRTLSTEFKN